MWRSLLFAPLVCLSLHADDSNWTTLDTCLEVVSEIGIANEWLQTQDAVTRPNEQWLIGLDQRLLGKHPSMGSVNAYFGAWLIVHPIISYKLHAPYRTWWQSATIGFELAVDAHNTKVGLRARW